ncbi:hypothetical protein BDV93DRAFT_508535 [Ceratobasidium sp. AG-I]|nr:hypothetical protein BDV93DRAFT_508535 [Ceratobasidium sp. AG-I]
MASQPRDYRRMLYRLDRATKYESIPALVQHMMEETVLDGILELRMVTSSGTGQPSPSTQLRLPSTFISFRREGRDVNAVALYGPRSSRTPPSSSSGRAPSPNTRHGSEGGASDFSLEVKKRYAPRTTLVWVFSPLVQRLITEGASTVLFECRSYLAGSDVAREVKAADAAAAAAHAAALERDAHYQQQQQQQMYQQQAQFGAYDPAMYQWQNDPHAGQALQQTHPGAVAHSAWNPQAMYPLGDATYLGGYASQTSEHYYSPPSGYDATSTSSPLHVQRSPTPRSTSQSHSRTHKTNAPAPPQPEKDEDPAIELLTRRAPFKRMLGYAGRQHDGSTAVYELADEVAAIAFTDGVSGIGMAGVEAMGTIGRGARRTSPSAISTSRRI